VRTPVELGHKVFLAESAMGLEPSMMEVVVTTDDGTVTFRVYGKPAATSSIFCRVLGQ
jgi:hypothetical protein